MSVDFNREVDRRSTSDVKWRPEGLKGYLPIEVSENEIPMWIADMDFACPECIVRAIKERADKEIFGYCSYKQEYYDALTWWFDKRFGMKIHTDLVSMMPTVVSAINVAIRAFSNPGDKVIIQQPVYDPFAELIKKTGRVMVNNGLICNDGLYEMDFPLLEEQAADPDAKIMILCSPHNPVGRVWTREELMRVGEICLKNNVFVISDEVHCDIIMEGYKFTSFASVSEEFAENCMICLSPGKTFNLAGIKSGCIFVRNGERRSALLDEISKVLHPNWLPALSYRAVEIAYTKCDAWMGEMLAVLNENKEMLVQFLNERLPKVRPVEMEGTYLQWLDFRAYGWDIKEQERIMQQEAQLFFDEGYRFGEEGEGFERMNLACPKAVLLKALERLETVLRRYE